MSDKMTKTAALEASVINALGKGRKRSLKALAGAAKTTEAALSPVLERMVSVGRLLQGERLDRRRMTEIVYRRPPRVMSTKTHPGAATVKPLDRSMPRVASIFHLGAALAAMGPA